MLIAYKIYRGGGKYCQQFCVNLLLRNGIKSIEEENGMMITSPKIKSLFIITCVCTGAVLQGCNASFAKSRSDSALNTLDKKTTQELYEGGVNVYLKSILPGGEMTVRKNNKLIKKTVVISRTPHLKQIIMQGKRGKRLKDCQFIAARIELDGKPQTADYLITTKGKGHCATDVRNYWIVQKSKNQPAKIEMEGLALRVKVYKPRSSNTWSGIKIRSTSRLKNMQLNCDSVYTRKNGRYQLLEENVEAYKPTGSMLNSHTPEMYWESVTGDEYHCRS